jgi:tetratricopeptide (TPR) repeat protein
VKRLLAASAATAALFVVACTTALELGERRYREGDPLGALSIWRAIDDDAFEYDAAQRRITDVEQEFEQLVRYYKKRALYYEERDRLAESVLNYRLALKLQQEDRATLAHVQELVRRLSSEREAKRQEMRDSFAQGDLPRASSALERLRTLDPFSPETTNDARQLEAALATEIERRLARGRRGFSSGDHAQAEQAFRSALELDPSNETAQGYLSFIERIRAQERHATAAARSSGVVEPREVRASDVEIRAEGLFRNAVAADQRGEPFEAIRWDLRALQAEPKHARARRHLDGLRERMRPDVPGLIESGRRKFQQEDLQGALDLWRRALLIEPNHEEAKEYAARAEQLLENLDRLRGAPLPPAVGNTRAAQP